MKHKHMTIAVFVPHLGCPHDCVFCNQKRITGVKTPQWTADSLTAHIDRHLDSGGDSLRYIEVGFFGGSFTGIPVHEQELLLSIAQAYQEKGQIQGIRLSTRPDMITEAVVNRLKLLGVTAVELGVQSFSEEVLQASERGHSVQAIYEAVTLLKAAGIEVGLQLMMGLPEDTSSRFIDSVNKALALNPKTLRIYPALVLKDTALEDYYRAGTYSPLTLDQAVELGAEAICLVDQSSTELIRMGLQASEGLSSGDDYVAGPWHPAFKALAESCLYQKGIDLALKDQAQPEAEAALVIHAYEPHMGVVAGHKRSNVAWLKARGIHKVVFQKSKEMRPYQVQIEWIKNR